MLLLRKSLKRRYIRQIIVYFLTWCLLFNTSVVLGEVVMTGNPAGTVTVTPLNGGNTQAMTATNGSIGVFSDFDIASGHTVTCVQG
ncbi:MAG: hypothetical protein ACYS21_01240, partial [Planctomycetota bacterium]